MRAVRSVSSNGLPAYSVAPSAVRRRALSACAPTTVVLPRSFPSTFYILSPRSAMGSLLQQWRCYGELILVRRGRLRVLICFVWQIEAPCRTPPRISLRTRRSRIRESEEHHSRSHHGGVPRPPHTHARTGKTAGFSLRPAHRLRVSCQPPTRADDVRLWDAVGTRILRPTRILGARCQLEPGVDLVQRLGPALGRLGALQARGPRITAVCLLSSTPAGPGKPVEGCRSLR